MTNEERQMLKERVDTELRLRGKHVAERACAGCGTDYDNYTEKCTHCSERRISRRRRSGRLVLPGGDDAQPFEQRDVPAASPPESIRVQPKVKKSEFRRCIYCARFCYGRACSHHRDLVQIESRGA